MMPGFTAFQQARASQDCKQLQHIINVQKLIMTRLHTVTQLTQGPGLCVREGGTEGGK